MLNIRVPKNEPKKQRTITIEDSLWVFAGEVGRGNFSAGIQFILRQAYEAAGASEEAKAEKRRDA